MKSSPAMEKALHEFQKKGYLTHRTENNQYLKVSYAGTGDPISKKWNVKIYTSGSVVTTDEKTLMDIVQGTFKPQDTTLKLIQIDDAGIGFPLGGVMVGVYDGTTIHTDTVDVSFFQGSLFDSQRYLIEYAMRGIDIITKIGATPKTHRIEICSGFINTMLKDSLRDMGFDVAIVDIQGVLQDQLEGIFKQYIKGLTGLDLAYDPKLQTPGQISKNYYSVVGWGRKNAAHLLKTGWKSLQS